MQITIFSFFMAILWCSLFVVLAALLEHNAAFIRKYGISPVMALMVFGIIRLFIPIEPGHSIVVGSDVVIPAIQHFFLSPCCTYDDHVFRWGDVFLAVWALGSILLIGRFLLLTIRTNRKLRTLRSLDDLQAAAVLERIVSDSRPRRKYRLIVTDETQTPMLIGFFEPVILLPPLQLSDRELSYILRHEWAHFVHKDLWKKLLIDLICAFLWWNPIAYIIKKNFDYALEVSCDRYVVRNGQPEEQIRYVETIVKIMQQMLDQKKDFLQASIPFVAANDQSMVMQRCELILNTPQKSGRHVIWPFACALALVLVSYLYIIQPRTQAPADAGISFSADNAYLVQRTGGGYDLYVDGKLQGNVSDEYAAAPPFSNLTIRESESRK